MFDYPGDRPVTHASFAFLTEADPDDWSALLDHCEVRRLHGGELLIAAGDDDRSLMILTDGELGVTASTRRGRGRVVARFAAGSVVGELSFLDGLPRTADVIALSDAEVLRLTFDAFESLAGRRPSLARKILLDLGRIAAGRARAGMATTRGQL
jgi:CRP-like cAMP-binding protein